MNKKKKKKKGLKIALIIVLCLLTGAGGGLGYYLYRQANSGLFFEDTTINGYDVSGRTCKEVMQTFKKNFSEPKICVKEQGEDAMTLTLEDMGYTINDVKLLSNIEKCMKEQIAGLLFSLMDGNTYEITIPYDFDEEVFRSAVNASALAAPRSSSADATLEYNKKQYYIEPEVYGNELDDADLQVMVKDAADRITSESRPAEDMVLEIPESFYFLPAVTQTDSELNRIMNINNRFCKAKITLTFGEKKETIDWDMIQNWLIIDGENADISEEALYEYVYGIAHRYDTLYYPRDFVTTYGNTLHYESTDYGYQIAIDSEVEQLCMDILSNTEVEREPVYEVKGYKRNGADDVCGYYVEADLTNQHLWFYKKGDLVIESDFVSGLPKDDRETITGVFAIPYKKSPETLKGDTWEEEVTFWMPFNDGQGLHDAPWRSAFGGNIYQTNGSHGCINLPYEVARVIYDNMEERIPIFIFK